MDCFNCTLPDCMYGGAMTDKEKQMYRDAMGLSKNPITVAQKRERRKAYFRERYRKLKEANQQEV